MTSICWPSPMSMTGMRTGGAGGFSSGVLRRGSISGSGSSKRGEEYSLLESEKKALRVMVLVMRMVRGVREDGENALVLEESAARVRVARSDDRFDSLMFNSVVYRLDICMCVCVCLCFKKEDCTARYLRGTSMVTRNRSTYCRATAG